MVDMTRLGVRSQELGVREINALIPCSLADPYIAFRFKNPRWIFNQGNLTK
jgi:hypothetical protein